MAIHLNHRTNTISTGQSADQAGITLVINNTGSITLPKGTTAERPSSAVAGDFRYNTTDNTLEYFDGTQWVTVVGGYVEDLRDTNGNLILDGIGVASPANYATVTNAATGDPVEIGVGGTDTNVSLNLKTKGAGTFGFVDGTGNLIEIRRNGTGAAVSAPSTLDIISNSTLTLQSSSDVVAQVTPTTGQFRVTDGTNNAFVVEVSGANGLSVKAGGSEAEITTAGDLRLISSGADVRIGDGTTDGLVVDTNAGGDGVTITTLTSSVQFSTNEKFVFAVTSGTVAADFGNKRVTGIDDPVDPTDAVNKRYVDGVAAGLDWKESVRVATTNSADLTGYTYNNANEPNGNVWTGVTTAPTIDGVTLNDGDRILIKDAPDPRGNGIFVYDATAQAFVRAPDANENAEVTAGLAVFVTEGTQNGDTGWVLITNDPITLGTTNLTFTQFTGAASFTISGNEGITASLTGTTWNISADTDEQTITKGTGPSGQLAVYAGSAAQPGQVLVAPAVTPGVASWGALDLSNANAVTGVLPVDHGGTGLASYTAGDILYASNATTLSKLAIGTASDANTIYVLKTNATGDAPEWGTITLNQLVNVSAPSPSAGDVLQFDGTEWVPVAGNTTDKLVRVTSNDTTSGYLDEKLVVTGAVTKTVLNPGANEQLQLNVAYDDVTIKLIGGQLAVGGGTVNQILVGTGNTTAATWTSAGWVQTFNFAGEKAGDAASFAFDVNGTMTLAGGGGVQLVASADSTTLTFNLFNNLGSAASMTADDELVFFAGGTTPTVVNVSAFIAYNNLMSVSTNGIVISDAGSAVTRSVVANASADKLGIEILNGDGLNGDITIGLNIGSLTLAGSASNADHFIPVYNAATDSNEKLSVGTILNNIDRTRINDATDTTYVDTDEVANKVVVFASSAPVAYFQNGNQANDQYFVIDSGTSAGTLRIEASGGPTDISIRLVPKGTGQVFIGDVGDGVVASDDGYNLLVTAGSAGNLHLKAGNSSGIVEIRDHASAQFVEFGEDHTITVYASGDTNALYKDFLFVGTTTNNTATNIGSVAVGTDETVTFDILIVGRDQNATDDSKSVSYRVKGIAMIVAGSGTTVAIQEVVYEGAAATGYDATVVSTTNGFTVQVTGGATDNVKWVATGRVVSVTH